MVGKLAMVAVGGAAGATLRYLVVLAATRGFGTGFPWGTLIVNVVGSFLMGLAVVMMFRAGDVVPSRFAPFVMTGILGGFTTFSAFSLDAVSLIERGRIAAAAAYMGGSVALSVGALLAGIAAARSLAA